jgi:hypothetical protein
MSRQIVMVTGPGRSGTSTMAGALVQLGLAVPGKAIGPNRTNPRGFFEPRWAVDFHKRLLRRALVGTLDPMPGARDRIATQLDDADVRSELRDWLADRLEERPGLVVKDPRLIWFVPLWTDVARELGVEPTHVVMLRHPAEVAGSRERYYKKADRDEARGNQIRYVAGWANVLLQTEAVTRGTDRVFVRYADLLADWRRQVSRIDARLGIGLGEAVAATPNPVDELIDPTLRRVRADGWQDVDVPGWLQGLGERTWKTFERLADDEPEAAVLDDVTDLAAEYEGQAFDATALTRRVARRAELRGYRRGLRDARNEQAERTPPSLVRRIRERLIR